MTPEQAVRRFVAAYCHHKPGASTSLVGLVRAFFFWNARHGSGRRVRPIFKHFTRALLAHGFTLEGEGQARTVHGLALDPRALDPMLVARTTRRATSVPA